jgi:DNA polymerase III alpha subunit
MPDVDIDLQDRDKLLQLIQCVPASMLRDGNLTKHLVGVYFQQIPQDDSGISAFDYEQAEQLGWQKFDFLNNSIYTGVKSEQHLVELLTTEPNWNLLSYREIVEQLAHINAHYDLLQMHLPSSIEQLAMFIALLRPGKRHLIGKSWQTIEAEIWIPTEKYYFKKSHAIAYATSIVVQLNLLASQSIECS